MRTQYEMLMIEPEYVLELSRAILGDRDGFVVVLNVYMDESGTHGGSPAITVGAYVGRPEVWAQWSKDWAARKAPINVYHAVDAFNRTGEFDGWTREDRNAYVEQLLPVIGSADLVALAVGIQMDDYRELLSEYPDLKDLVGEKPYAPCFQWVLHTLLDMMDRNGDPQPIAIFHEVNDFKTEAMEAFGFLQEMYPNRQMTIAFGGKKDFMPLQAADILAYEANHTLRDPEATGRKPWIALNPTGKAREFKFFSKKSLKEWADGVRRKKLDSILSAVRV